MKATYSDYVNSNLYAAPNRTPLSWRTRIQIAIDVANALVNSRLIVIFLLACVVHEIDLLLICSSVQEYLHFYCDPPLCHRDIKSSNILLDDNFVAKVEYMAGC